MTHEIKLSTAVALGITDRGIQGIQDAVLAFSDEVKAWNHRNEMVEKTKNEEDELQRWTPCPAPTAHELIMRAVGPDGSIDYKVDDDTEAVKAAQFDTKQRALFQRVSSAETSEVLKVVPLGKDRLWRLQEEDIIARDAIVRQGAANELIGKEVDVAKLHAYVLQHRKPEDQKFIDAQDERRDVLKKIERWAAEQHAEIADLTKDTIDAWAMTPFSI